MSGAVLAFRDAVAALLPTLRRYAGTLARNAEDADDLVQHVALRALTKERLFEPGTDLRAWLFTMMHNEFVNRVRRDRAQGVKLDLDAVRHVGVGETQERRLQARDFARALSYLPADQQRVVLLVGYDGLTYEQAADYLGCAVGTVRSRLSRGRARLMQMMGGA